MAKGVLFGVLTALASLVLACGGDDGPGRPARSLPSVDGTVDSLAPASTAPFTLSADPQLSGPAALRAVRLESRSEAGGWDRVVFEFEDALPAGEIEYVEEVKHCTSGERVRMPSTAVLVVRFSPAEAHDEADKSTLRALDLRGTGYAILRARQTCDSDGEVAWAVAVNGRQPFKVTVLSDPARVVIDVEW